MSHEDLTEIPSQVVRGTTVDYRRTYADFPASQGWALTLYVAGASTLTKNGVADGDSFTFALAAADTATLAAGNYLWEERAVKSGAGTHAAASGVFEILPDLATATPGSLQTQEAKYLAAVEAALAIRFGMGSSVASDIIESYSVGTRSLVKMPTRELMDLRAQLKAAVKAQSNPGRAGAQYRVHFPGIEAEV